MALTRWRPFRDMMNIQEEVNRLFDVFLVRPLMRTEWSEGVWNPSVDISETKDNVIIKAEIPGLNKEEVNISVRDNMLTLTGEKKQEKEEKQTNYHRIERSYGVFSRSFALPTSVKNDNIKATYKDGVLSVTLPKTEDAKPKEIPISIE